MAPGHRRLVAFHGGPGQAVSLLARSTAAGSRRCCPRAPVALGCTGARRGQGRRLVALGLGAAACGRAWLASLGGQGVDDDARGRGLRSTASDRAWGVPVEENF